MDIDSTETHLDLQRLLAIKEEVVRLAREVGRWARERSDRHHAGTQAFDVSVKTVPGDVVTEVDVEGQRRIAERLRAGFPGFGLLGEEGLSEVDERTPTWVIDPIDGTHNFVRGYPGFCVSIGLVEENESVLGVIYDAGLDTVYWAVKGGGAWREAERVRLTDRAVRDALITTNFTDASAGNLGHRDFFVELAGRSSGVRASGSACRDLCFVADGRVDLFWQFGLRAWDVAAGIALVREAGGEVRFLGGGDRTWLQGGRIDVVAGAPSPVAEAMALAERVLD